MEFVNFVILTDECFYHAGCIYIFLYGSAVVRLPFERRRSALKHAQTSVPRVRASESDVASSLGDGSRRFIEAQKAALKGTPYDPDVLAEKMKAPEENP